MRKENNYNLMMREATSFNRAITMQHIIDGPKTVKALAKAMFISEVMAWQHLSWLYTNEFAKSTMVKNYRMVKAYTAINVDKYKWPKSYLASDDPRRDYFDKMIYPNITKELRDAIYEGACSSGHQSLVSCYGEVDRTLQGVFGHGAIC